MTRLAKQVAKDKKKTKRMRIGVRKEIREAAEARLRLLGWYKEWTFRYAQQIVKVEKPLWFPPTGDSNGYMYLGDAYYAAFNKYMSRDPTLREGLHD